MPEATVLLFPALYAAAGYLFTLCWQTADWRLCHKAAAGGYAMRLAVVLANTVHCCTGGSLQVKVNNLILDGIDDWDFYKIKLGWLTILYRYNTPPIRD